MIIRPCKTKEKADGATIADILSGSGLEPDESGVEPEKSLKELNVDYIDTMLIHTPVTSAGEFKAGFTPHFFEFGHDAGQYSDQPFIAPIRTIDGDDMLELLLEARMERHKKAGIDYKQATEWLIHRCISLMFPDTFLQQQWSGCELTDGAGKTHFGYPIIGSWVTDHPESEKIGLLFKWIAKV